MSVPPATFGVVIPVSRDPEGIRRVLASIHAVDWDPAALHIVVGVDGPHPPTESAAREGGAAVVVLDRNRGSYATRNAAIDALPAVDAVAFTDADCIVTPAWLRGHAAALREAELSGGAINVTLRARPSAAEYVDRLRHLKQEGYVQYDGFAATANLAVRWDVLAQQRFDDRLRSGGDADFCLRARARGFRLVYSPDAAVDHPARTTNRQVVRKVRRICRGILDNPQRWVDRVVLPPRLSLSPARIAHREGLSNNPLWWGQAVLLQYYADVHVYVSARRAARRGRRLLAASSPESGVRD